MNNQRPGNQTYTSDGLLTVSEQAGFSQLLMKVRRRLWLLDGAQGLCWGLIAAIGTMLVGMWFDLVWELPASIRFATWICASVTMLAMLGWLLSRTWQGIESRRITRRIDVASGCHGELLNGFEFAAGLKSSPGTRTSPSADLTAGLAEMAIERALQLADRVEPAKVVSPLRAWISARWLAGTFGALAFLVIVCPTLARNQWQRFARPWDDTPPYSPYQITVEPGDTEVLYGQGLEIHTSITGPLVREVHLMVTAGNHTEKVPMFPEANGAWRAQLSRLTENTRYLVRVDRARSSEYKIRVITTPKIEDVQFIVTPPAYTHESATSGPLPKGGLVGLPGTRIQATVRSNRPLSSGEIRLKGDGASEVVVMHSVQTGDMTAVGEFTVKHSAKFEIQVTDTDGQQSQEPFIGSVTLLVDQRPLVRILEPKAQSLATPTSNLPVILDAEDDYGLSRVELHRSLNDSRPLATALALPDPPPRRFREHHYLPLAQYALQPGDEIKLFSRVTDNDPAGAKGAESTIVSVRIISQEDFEQMIRAREGMEVLVSKYQQGKRRLEKLTEEVEQLRKKLDEEPEDSELSKELQERLEQLAKDMQEEANAIAAAAEHELPYDLDQNLKKHLDNMVQELRKRGDELDELAQKAKEKDGIPKDALKRQLAKLAEQMNEQKEQFDQEAGEPLEHLEKVYPLMEDEARFTALVLWQKDLAERLATYKDIEQSEEPAAKARLRDLQDEQRRARDVLTKLLDDIEDHVRELPDGEQFDELRETATKFAAELRASGAAQEMTDAETSLTDFRGDAAYRHAESAAEILDSFLKKCEGMGGAGSSCLSFNPKLSQSLGNSIEQLLNDAGLSSGGASGKGQGRGGYSARTGNNNIGLYGGMPSMGTRASSGQGFGKANKSSSGKNKWADPTGDPANVTSPWQRSASSAATGPVPPQYRRRINLYFQRVGDELEAAGK